MDNDHTPEGWNHSLGDSKSVSRSDPRTPLEDAPNQHKHERKISKDRVFKLEFHQDILFFVINYFFPFPENVKKALQSVLCLRTDPRPAFDSFPMKIVNTKYLHAFELDQDPFSEFCDDHLQTYEPQETKIDSIPSVHTPIPCKIPYWYKPLILPPISHAFPKHHDLYLPRFDGECDNITTERHVLNFESFLDLFEFDEEDVSIRPFSLSLQQKVKSWFKTLPDVSISDF